MIQPIKIFLFSACLSLALAGCASTQGLGLAPNIEIADLTQLPAPTNAREYTIGGQEELEITVSDSERLSGKFLTDAEGYIAYPLVGDLFVRGKTPRQAARMIADRLRGDYVINPQVQVRPSQVLTPSISIGGQVAKPGTYPSATSQTLTRAINNAGGTAEFAATEEVLVMRTVDGQRYIGVFNIAAIQRGNYQDPILYSDDIVIVGDSPSRRRLDKILQLVPVLSTAVILIDRIAR